MIALLDNTVMSNFSVVERPDLVRKLLGDTVATTEQAFAELETGVEIGKLPACDWSWLSVMRLRAEESDLYDQLCSTLNAGEAACLAIASHRQYQVMTDDHDARELAQQMGISTSGTFGILLLLFEREHLTLAQADALLKKMISAGYRSPVDSLIELL